MIGKRVVQPPRFTLDLSDEERLALKMAVRDSIGHHGDAKAAPDNAILVRLRHIFGVLDQI